MIAAELVRSFNDWSFDGYYPSQQGWTEKIQETIDHVRLLLIYRVPQIDWICQ